MGASVVADLRRPVGDRPHDIFVLMAWSVVKKFWTSEIDQGQGQVWLYHEVVKFQVHVCYFALRVQLVDTLDYFEAEISLDLEECIIKILLYWLSPIVLINTDYYFLY